MSTSENNLNYTDWHHVDEELRAITLQNGYWTDGNLAGITYREMKYYSTTTFDCVASLKNKNSLSRY